MIYSLVLRLQGIFLLRSILGNNEYSRHKFKKWLIGETNLSEKEFQDAYEIYEGIRSNRKSGKHAKAYTAGKLMMLLEKEVKRIGKKKKSALKRELYH